MVYFGTGRYYRTGDNSVGNVGQSFYAIPDNGLSGTAVTLSALLQKTAITSYTEGSESRTISSTNPNWTTQLGWYLNLDNVNGVRNERVISKALLIQDKVIVTTLLPTAVPCDVGGKSWLMEIPAVGNKYVDTTVIAKNLFDNQIYLGEQNVSINPLSKPVSSVASSGASSSASSSVSPDDCDKMTNLSLINSGTNGGKLSETAAKMNSCGTGRQAWRQLR